MGRQYYCDYCDRSFADNPTSRRNHLKGVHHQRMKREHYASFRDLSTILAEESMKQPCNRFINTGTCHFGNKCRFSHLTAEMRKELEQKIAAQKKSRRNIQEEAPSITKWLEKRPSQLSKDTGQEQTVNQPCSAPSSADCTLPDSLASVINLPPSLLPMNPETLQGIHLEGWG